MFKDDDGSAYIICTNCHVGDEAGKRWRADGTSGRTMTIYKLSDDYMSFATPLQSSGVLPGPDLIEAPDMFKVRTGGALLRVADRR